MTRHKWLMFWLVMLAWNSAMFGMNTAKGRTGFAVASAITVIVCGITVFWQITHPRKP